MNKKSLQDIARRAEQDIEFIEAVRKLTPAQQDELLQYMTDILSQRSGVTHEKCEME